jgi:hypothetical protein
MDSPRRVKIAIFLSWTVLAIETVERLWRISTDPDARTFSRFGLVWTAVTLASTVIVAASIFFASQRRNWGRIMLLICTLGAWSLWLFWPHSLDEHAWWQSSVYGCIAGMELVALVLLFFGESAAWYRPGPGRK